MMSARSCQHALHFACALLACVLAFSVSAPLFAATGDPLPGIDVLIKRKGPGTVVNIGSADLPAIPADFFFPGSDPFTGIVALDPDSDGDGVDETSSLSYIETANPNVLDVRMEPITLVSEAPILVTSASGFESFFNVTYEILADGLPPGEPVRGTLELLTGIPSPGSSTSIEDMFFDVEIRVSFSETGTGNPAGSTMLLPTRVRYQSKSFSIPTSRDSNGRLILGSDGTSIEPIEFASDGGGHVLTIQSVPEPSSLVLMGLVAIALARRRRR